jgi:hypothetical protein
MLNYQRPMILLTCLQNCYTETAESIDANNLLTDEEKVACKLRIFILRKTLQERIMELLQIHDTHCVNNWIKYLLSIDAVAVDSKTPRAKPTDDTRYKINFFVVSAQIKLLQKPEQHTHTLEQYLQTNSGSPDHQAETKDNSQVVIN